MATFEAANWQSVNSSCTTMQQAALDETGNARRAHGTFDSSASSLMTVDNSPLLPLHKRAYSLIPSARQLYTSNGSSRRASAPMPDPSRLRKLFSPLHPFLEAAKMGNAARIESLINPTTVKLVDSKDNWTALHFAAAGGHIEIVQLLLAHMDSSEPRTKRQDRTPLFLAVQTKQEETVRILLEGGADIAASSKMDGATALHRASLDGEMAIVQLLLSHGASVHAADVENLRPLMWAVQGKRYPVVKLLVASGARLEDRSHTSGLTVLHRAVSSGDGEMVKVLLRLGADANADAPLGMHPLHRAAAAGNVDIVNMLTETEDVDLEVRTAKGWTPLHCAARQGHRTVCHMLLEAGSEMSAVTRKGLTADQLARKWGLDNVL